MAAPAAAQKKAAIVIGAGVSGLKAAADLAAAGYGVTVLEARDRIGGRIWTVQGAGGPIELGAQWIHGSRNPIRTLASAQRWKVAASSLTGEAYMANSPDSATIVSDREDNQWDALFSQLEDFITNEQETASNARSLQWGIDKWVSTQSLTPRQRMGLDQKIDDNWVQEYAASPPNLSLNWFDNDEELAGGDTILTAGYNQVTNYLQSQLTSRGGRVVLNAPVTAVATSANSVTVTAGGTAYTGAFAIVTLPVGVLKAGTVSFSPALPAAKTTALSRIGMGNLNKVVLGFPAAARWDNVNWIERVPLPADEGRWREFFSLRKITRRPVMVAFNAGDPALYSGSLTDQTLVSQAVAALRGLFGASNIPNPTDTWVTRWHVDPYSYGSYSVMAPGATGGERNTLREPVGKVLFWAGEATSSKWPATVQGAWQSGADAAAAAVAANR